MQKTVLQPRVSFSGANTIRLPDTEMIAHCWHREPWWTIKFDIGVTDVKVECVSWAEMCDTFDAKAAVPQKSAPWNRFRTCCSMRMHVGTCVNARETHRASGSPDAGSWARKWSSAHGSVPAGSWGSSGGRPGTPPAAGAAVPAQTGPPSPRSASPVPAGANYASHQSSACWGQMLLSSCRHCTQAPQVERHSLTQWVRDFKDKDDEPALIEKHTCTHTQAEVPEEGGERQKLPLSLVQHGTASQGQVVRSRLRQRRQLAQTRSIPLPSLAAPEKEDRGSGRVSTVWVAEPTANLCSALQQQLLHCVFSTAGLSLRSLKRVIAKL